MPTVVHRIELTEGIPDIHMPDGYSGLMVLVTLRGIPLGDISIKTLHGTVGSRYLTRQIAKRFCGRILQLLLEQGMDAPARPPVPEARPLVAVIVCTSGRPAELRRCLQSLSDISYQRKSVIVVDNSSQCEMIHDIARKYGACYVREKKKGLDFARNAGLRATEAEFVAFADDDVVVDRAWLDSIVQAFRRDEAIACVTGLTMPLELETEAQELFERYCEGGMRRGYERRVFDRFNLPPPVAGKVGVGANMAFRSAVLEKVGTFDEALDCGTPAKAGGDLDMFYRLLRRGYKICYEPSALAWHRHRAGTDELCRQLAGYSTAVYALLTKCVVEYRDLGAVYVGCSWFAHQHLRNLALAVVGKGPMPWSLIVAELRGLVGGPTAYVKSKSYVSQIRLQQGLERRGCLNRCNEERAISSDFLRRASAVAARLTSGWRRTQSA